MELTSLVRAAKGSREQQVNWVTGGHGNLSLLPPCSCQPGWTHGNGKQFQGQGWRGLEPLRVLTLPGQRDRAGGHRYLRDTVLLTLPLQQQGIFLTAKKNKVQAKTVINTRANSEEFGQSHGSAAPTRTSTASLEVTGSRGGITAPHQHQTCSQPSLTAQGALHSSLSFLEAANFSQITCQLTKPFVLLWYVSFPYHEKLGQVFPLVFFFLLGRGSFKMMP